MKRFYIISMIFFLNINIHSQSHIFYTSAGTLTIADLNAEKYYRIQECWNVWDYAFNGEKLFVLASSEFQNKILCNQDQFDKVYYCYLKAENLNNPEFKEMNIRKPRKLFLSPDNTKLLIRSADRLVLLNTNTLQQDTLDIPEGLEIIGWKSKDAILFQDTNRIAVFNISTYKLEKFVEAYGISNYYIEGYKNITDKRCLFRVGDKYIQRCFSLSQIKDNKLSSIYVAQWYFLDYQFIDEANILMLDTRSYENRGNVYFLTLIDIWRKIKVQIDLSKMLNISFIQSELRLAENTMNNTFILFVNDYENNSYFLKGSYKDLLNSNGMTFKRYNFPGGMVNLLRVYELD